MKKIFLAVVSVATAFMVSAQYKAPQIIANGGYHTHASSGSKNTMSALKAAQKAKFYGSECDVNLTKDGEVLVVQSGWHPNKKANPKADVQRSTKAKILEVPYANGEKVCTLLSENGFQYTSHCFHQDMIEPDEHSVGSAIMHYEHDCDLVIGVGSGVINDIGKIVSASITFNGKLPKKAVNQAYEALMDAYQQDFYEGNYTTTGSSTPSSVSQTNYEKYEGNFNRYLIAKALNGKEGTVKDAKAAVRVMAEDAVKEIMYVYILTDMVEEAWDTELSLTKQEKKDFADYLEYYAYQMSLYGQTFTYNLEDAYNGAQFDKTMEFLLTSEETTDAESGIEYDKYTHITYTGK